jgi:hypothetical protein
VREDAGRHAEWSENALGPETKSFTTTIRSPRSETSVWSGEIALTPRPFRRSLAEPARSKMKYPVRR